MKKELIDIIKTISMVSAVTAKGCRIVSLTYQGKPKKAGDVPDIARYTVLCGVSLEKAYARDVATLERKLPGLSGIERTACQEMLDSKKTSLEVGIGNNPAYNQPDLYENVAPGLRVNKETGKVQIYGFLIRREVITKGVYQPVKSSEKTLAKKRLAKGLASERFRPFVVDPEQLERVAANGQVIKL